MSDNPFDTDNGNVRGFYSDFVAGQLKGLSVGESIKADLGGRSKSKFRSMMTYSAASLGIGVKSKSGKNGSVWVIRSR